MSDKAIHFFSDERQKAEKVLGELKRRLLLLAMLRLIFFLLIFLPLLDMPWQTWLIALWCLAWIGLFLYAVSKYTDLRTKKEKVIRRISICKAELAALNGDFSSFGNGVKFMDGNHPFAYDMDVFGERSFFQSINRASTPESEALLAATLVSNLPERVVDRQAAIRELSGLPEWCLDFRVHAGFHAESTDQQAVVKAMAGYTQSLPKGLEKLALVFGFMNVVLMVLWLIGIISASVLLIPFLVGLMLTGVYLARVNKISSLASKLSGNLNQQADVLAMIEDKNWSSTLLTQFLFDKQGAQIKNSAELKRLARLLAALDQRNNIFFALFANGFFLWDLRQGKLVENWIIQNAPTVSRMFELMNFFDVQVSCSNYAFTHAAFCYPKVIDQSKIHLQATGLGHPLLAEKKRVVNDFEVQEGQFFVITGANMAGKSTFLRTVGISIMMANAGLPVCADAFTYTPVKLISSMRSSDSLVNDESYFFAELKRLRFVMDELAREPHFIILDEILKGTNSKDKEMGSKKLLVKLVATTSTGLIATHDLSLCDLANEHTGIQNVCFDAEIIDDELHFDYRLKPGVCKNMNASFLLRKMRIVD